MRRTCRCVRTTPSRGKMVSASVFTISNGLPNWIAAHLPVPLPNDRFDVVREQNARSGKIPGNDACGQQEVANNRVIAVFEEVLPEPIGNFLLAVFRR